MFIIFLFFIWSKTHSIFQNDCFWLAKQRYGDMLRGTMLQTFSEKARLSWGCPSIEEMAWSVWQWVPLLVWSIIAKWLTFFSIFGNSWNCRRACASRLSVFFHIYFVCTECSVLWSVGKMEEISLWNQFVLTDGEIAKWALYCNKCRSSVHCMEPCVSDGPAGLFYCIVCFCENRRSEEYQ